MKSKNAISAYFSRLWLRMHAFVAYCSEGVWADPSKTFKVRLIKTINLSVNSFFDRGLQIKSMSLTYSTVLALVPAIALLVAIGRGFGLQDYLQNELYYFFPSQHKAISTALSFVDSYLSQASQGVFVGVGIIVLLWTVISLLSYIEDAFNSIWDVKTSRTIYQKVTDYIAICMMVPILMICSSGLSIFMSTTIQDNLSLPFLTPLINVILEISPLFLAWLAFTLSFFLIPNKKVSFRYAAISGLLCAVAFQILQLLFVNGQIYVSKYNAIYGSFAFLPLLLIWLQLSWMLLLCGCVLTYSLQNVFTFNFMGDIRGVSDNMWHSVSLIVMTIVVKRFLKKEKPLTMVEIASSYNLPIRMVGRVSETLVNAGLVYRVKIRNGVYGLTPAREVEDFNVEEFFRIYDGTGETKIIPDFEEIYADLLDILNPISEKAYLSFSSLLLRDLPIPSPGRIKAILQDKSN